MQRLRGATGAVVLSTALFIGSGAVAAADTGGADPSSRSSRAPESAGQSSAPGSRDSAAPGRPSLQSSLRDIARGVEARLDRLTPSRESESSPTGTVEDAATDGIDDLLAEIDDVIDPDDVDVLPAPEVPTTVPEPTVPVTVPTTPVEPVTVPDATEAAPTSDGDRTGGSSAEPDSSTSTGSGSASPWSADPEESAIGDHPVPERPRPIIRVVSTVTAVVASLGNAVAAVPPVVLALPYSSTPVTDVITMLETILASVSESATAAARLPADIAALFGLAVVGTGGPAVIAPPSDRVAAPIVAGTTPAAHLPAPTTSLPIVSEPTVGEGVPSSAAGLFIPTALASYSRPLESVPPAAPAVLAEQRSLIDRVFDGLLVPLSLWALAAGALPGLAGLLILLGAGARVGYRQAKAGIAVRVAGIGRFAGPGPLGVVRSASLIAVHQRRTGDRASLDRVLGDQVA